MMRMLGVMLLVLSGLVWGLGKAGSLGQRVVLLTELLGLMQFLRTGIGCYARPLGELLAAFDSRLCREALALPGFAGHPAGALLQAGEKLFSVEGDRENLRAFTEGLGVSGTQGQLEHLELYMALTEERLKEAKEECSQKRKLYVALGLFAGLTVCIVIL